ncbi:MAG: hypothetical protein JW797_02750 [Bradymonadales bacterium]|nr:hypothetical protein [Bradymonadales bacterium]
MSLGSSTKWWSLVCGLALLACGCAPQVQLPSLGHGRAQEQERLANQRALQLLVARENQPVRPTPDRAQSEPVADLPILPVVVLAPAPTDAELGRGVIDKRSLMDFLQRGPHALLSSVLVEPEMEGDTFRGFRVEAIGSDSGALAGCGLRVGDVVTAVNGQDISHPEGFMEVWDSLERADHLHVDLVRGGEARTLQWQIEGAVATNRL